MRMGRRETKPATIIRVIAASSRSGSTVFPSFCGVLHAPPKLLRMVPADSTRELSDLCENCEHLQDGRVEEACFAETFSYIWIIRCTLERKWKRWSRQRRPLLFEGRSSSSRSCRKNRWNLLRRSLNFSSARSFVELIIQEEEEEEEEVCGKINDPINSIKEKRNYDHLINTFSM